MKNIYFLLLIGVFTLNSCGPSAEEKRQMQEQAQERREREKELNRELAFENIESTMKQDWEKCYKESDMYFEDYEIYEWGGGYVLEVTVYWYPLLASKRPYYTCKLKYDSRGKFKKCISQTKY